MWMLFLFVWDFLRPVIYIRCQFGWIWKWHCACIGYGDLSGFIFRRYKVWWKTWQNKTWFSYTKKKYLDTFKPKTQCVFSQAFHLNEVIICLICLNDFRREENLRPDFAHDKMKKIDLPPQFIRGPEKPIKFFFPNRSYLIYIPFIHSFLFYCCFTISIYNVYL